MRTDSRQHKVSPHSFQPPLLRRVISGATPLFLTVLATIPGTVCQSAVMAASYHSKEVSDSIVDVTAVRDSLPADSAYSLLPGVNVTGVRALHVAGVSAYYPTRREKNASRDAFALLERLMIPQLSKKQDGGYTAANGTPLAYYINGHPAEQQDLGIMNMRDVRKVLFLDHPSDPRYLGAQYVVEFVMQEYAYGGYTKLTGQVGMLSEERLSAGCASKFTYGRMVFDLYTSADSHHPRRDAYESCETFLLKDGTVTRFRTPTHSGRTDLRCPLQFRASYSHGETYISNEVGYSYDARRHTRQEGTVSFMGVGAPVSGGAPEPYGYTVREPLSKHSANWKGFASFTLGRGWSLSARSSVAYTHLRRQYSYSTDRPFTIRRDVRENAVEADANIVLGKKLNVSNSVSLDMNGWTLTSHSNYSGDYHGRNSFSLPKVFGSLRYSYQSRRLLLTAYAGMAAEWNSINDHSIRTVHPYAVANVSYSPGSRSQLSLWTQYSVYSPTASIKNPTREQESELMWSEGNPELKPYPKFEVGPSFAWSPSNTLSLGASVMYTNMHRITVYTYSAVSNGDALLQSFSNGGDTNVANASLSASLSLFNGRLTLYASPSVTLYRGSGLDMPDLDSFGLYGAAYLYAGNFWASVRVRLSTKDYASYTMSITQRWRQDYGFSCGWSNDRWSVWVTADNLFRRSWKSCTSQLLAPVYSLTYITFDPKRRQNLSFGAECTFGYGKKIQRGNDLTGGVTNAQSAVL